ncbi:MAG: 6,7-dimethyl-8-ribityllumazine synthase, partial [Saprospiraceae bacterium]
MATASKNLSEFNLDLSKRSVSRTLKISLVVAKWNKEITEGLRDGAMEALQQLGLYKRNISVVEVPGSFELPFAAKQVIDNQEVDAVICIGSVIKGETSHFDYVCQGVTYGIQELNIKGDVPVIFCVLTDDNIQQSKDRSGGKHGNKGV